MRAMPFAFAVATALAGAAPAAGCATGSDGGAVELAGRTTLARGVTRVAVDAPSFPVAGIESATLQLAGFTYEATPRVMYLVYLEGHGGSREFVGVINFFNAGAAGGSSDVSLDATAALRRLDGRVAALVLEPTRGVTAAAGSAEVQADAGARVRFASASLQLR